MKLLEIQAREVFSVFEFSISDLEKISLALACAELKPETEEEKEAVSFLTNSVYPIILQTVKEIKGKEE